MNSEQIFAMGLGISSPWILKNIDFKTIGLRRELHIEIDFIPGSEFPDKEKKSCKVHDTVQKTWRHLNFFQHECYLHCRVPRIITSSGKVMLVEVPWARKESGFTLLFEAYTLMLMEHEMPVNKVGKAMNEYPKRIWTIFNHWIKKAYNETPVGNVTQLGVDETSRRKGHKYMTIAVDLKTRRVIHATDGKHAETLGAVAGYLKSKNINPQKIEHISMDLSPAFISGAKQYFPEAEIHFDRFHVKKLLNEAMDEVRKLERKEHDALKGHKYTFLKNPDKLSVKKKAALNEFITLYPTLGEAYRLKILFDDVWEMPTPEEAYAFIFAWQNEVYAHKIYPLMKFCKTVMSHRYGIINFFKTKINNGILEGINSKIQLAKARARGYANIDNFINMVYFLCGKLEYNYPRYPLGST